MKLLLLTIILLLILREKSWAERAYRLIAVVLLWVVVAFLDHNGLLADVL